VQVLRAFAKAVKTKQQQKAMLFLGLKPERVLKHLKRKGLKNIGQEHEQVRAKYLDKYPKNALKP
jgi:hypothetical protein